ncbi:hypothetical protein [Polyangium fumosum]|uniref:DUF1573 domain-containing protein n=1 Tax=Polyangium fumosum TaxID=889272 RepID=A0A4U1J962_9BACT|nr:hypothetical protein [Polyangium fumosum]TKD04006.1 hypothetical protein E8A74_24465 [Polyangium fumosum]
MRSSRASLLASLFCLSSLVSPSAHAAPPAKATKAQKAPEPPPLPPAQARLWIVAPTMTGPWTMRIDNEGTVPLRVPADPRLLRFEIEVEGEKKPTSCELPKSLRPSSFPESRALLLGPGQSYVEPFDPRLFCFGKAAAALRPGVTLHARFGWDPPKKGTKKPPEPPFAAESTEREPTITPAPELLAPAIVLGESPPPPPPAANANGAKPSDGKPAAPAPVVDERAGRLEISADAFKDVAAPNGVSLTVTAKNAGLRPIFVALRPWMFSFRIDGPYGHTKSCLGDPPRGLPPDAFRTLKPGASTSFTILLHEVCPRGTFPRPGLYRVTTTLNAGETTQGAEAYTAEVSTQSPTLLRLASAPDPFFAAPPKALPPPPPQPADTSSSPAPDAPPSPEAPSSPAPAGE